MNTWYIQEWKVCEFGLLRWRTIWDKGCSPGMSEEYARKKWLELTIRGRKVRVVK